MIKKRPIPPPAIFPPPGREPERKFLRLRDGYETSVYIHRPPDDAPKGKLPVLYAHGIQSHPGWFYGSALALADAGHTVYQLTRRGSGDNTQKRGDCRSRKQLLDDVNVAIGMMCEEKSTEGVHLLGVSWGGKLLTACLVCGGKTCPTKIESLTLVAPGIVPRADVQFRVKIRIVGSLVVHPSAYYDIPLSEPALFTDNEAMRKYLKNDAYRLHKATARFLFESRLLDRDITRAKAGAIPCPTTLILSKRDQIIDNDKTRDVVQKLVKKKGNLGRDVQATHGQDVHATEELLNIVELDGAHTLEFEQDPTAFYGKVVEAMERGEKGEENDE